MVDVFRLHLVEDDPDDEYLMKMSISELDIPVEVRTFENGKLLFENLRDKVALEELPHLVLLDLNLPVWDGKKTLSALKKHARLKSIPVVVFTTSRSDEDMIESYRLGANSYIVKPSKFEDLLETVETITRYWFRTVKHWNLE